MKEVFAAIREAMSMGEDAVLLSVIAASGSTPRGTGAKMLVLRDGSTRGTIGGGAVERRAAELAAEAFLSKSSLIKGFDLSSCDKSELGMVCGGSTTVYFQFLSAKDERLAGLLKYEKELEEREEEAWLVTAIREDSLWQLGIYAEGRLSFMEKTDEQRIRGSLGCRAALIKGETSYYTEPLVMAGRAYVFGGGHVSQALVPVLSGVGFRVQVLEDRERFCDIALFPGAQTVVEGDFSRVSESFEIKEKDCCVIMTRGHEADYVVLEQVLRTPAYYIGMIGSRSKLAFTQKKLREAGFSEEDIERIHNPIGLPILAETPEEIAVSVAAEMILQRALHRGGKA